MQIVIDCAADQVSEYIDFYEGRGFQLMSKIYEDGIAILTFKGYSSSHIGLESYYNPDVQAHLEFSDGTTSRLHVRRSNWMDD